MGFSSAPKPNKALEQAQLEQAQRAKTSDIQLLQQQLQGEDQARAQVYGVLPSSTNGTGSGSGYGSGFGNGYGGFGGGGGLGGWGGFMHSV